MDFWASLEHGLKYKAVQRRGHWIRRMSCCTAAALSKTSRNACKSLRARHGYGVIPPIDVT